MYSTIQYSYDTNTRNREILAPLPIPSIQSSCFFPRSLFFPFPFPFPFPFINHAAQSPHPSPHPPITHPSITPLLKLPPLKPIRIKKPCGNHIPIKNPPLERINRLKNKITKVSISTSHTPPPSKKETTKEFPFTLRAES